MLLEHTNIVGIMATVSSIQQAVEHLTHSRDWKSFHPPSQENYQDYQYFKQNDQEYFQERHQPRGYQGRPTLETRLQ